MLLNHLGTILYNGLQTGLVVVEIFLQFSRLNIEDIDQNLIITNYNTAPSPHLVSVPQHF